jgi:hypothetical protein
LTSSPLAHAVGGCFSAVTVWYALHGHTPEDVTSDQALVGQVDGRTSAMVQAWMAQRSARSGTAPVVAISGLADLGHYQHRLRLHLDPPAPPVEFFDDPAHAPDCPLRSPATEPANQG